MSGFLLKTLAVATIVFNLAGIESVYGQSDLDNIPTYHVSYDNGKMDSQGTMGKSPHVMSLIRFHELDILGPQEGIFYEEEYIRKEIRFPDVEFKAPGQELRPGLTSLCYNPEKFELLEHDSFTSSPHPSNDPETQPVTQCQWGKFKNRQDGQIFYVFDINHGSPAESVGALRRKLMLEKIQQINRENLPYILTGSFNMAALDAPGRNLNENTDIHEGEGVSFAHVLP